LDAGNCLPKWEKKCLSDIKRVWEKRDSRLSKGSNDFLRDTPKRPGVYRVHLVRKGGKFDPVKRLGGIDDEGIIYIGKTTNLRRRLRLQLKRYGGKLSKRTREYLKYYLGRFPHKSHSFSWKCTKDESEAVRAEKKLLKSYFKRFLEEPPRNRALALGESD